MSALPKLQQEKSALVFPLSKSMTVEYSEGATATFPPEKNDNHCLRLRPDRDAFFFCGAMVSIVFISSVLQALVESGRENPRFKIPTEPLLTITVVYVATSLVPIIGKH